MWVGHGSMFSMAYYQLCQRANNPDAHVQLNMAAGFYIHVNPLEPAMHERVCHAVHTLVATTARSKKREAQRREEEEDEEHARQRR